jgi:protein lin-54
MIFFGMMCTFNSKKGALLIYKTLQSQWFVSLSSIKMSGFVSMNLPLYIFLPINHNCLFNGLFPITQGVPVSSTEECKLALEEKNPGVKEEKCEKNAQIVIYQATDSSLSENILSAPMIADCRLVYHICPYILQRNSKSSLLCKYWVLKHFSVSSPLAALPPSNSKRPRSSTKLSGHTSRVCNLQAPPKSDIMMPPFKNYAEMVFGNSTSDTLKGSSSPQTSVKVVSPNKKRISPPRIGTGLSPICKSGRKLILKSIPSFPSLGGDANTEDQKGKSPAP